MDSDTEYRDAPAAKGSLLTGYAAVFNSSTTIAGAFYERLAPGAFARSLAETDVLALVSHDRARVLGRLSSGTLRLSEDAKGLRYEIDAATGTPDGAAMSVLVGRGDIRGASFGFIPIVESWQETGGLPVRTLIEVELIEISLTGWPAYPDTSAALRSMDRHVDNAALRARIRAQIETRRTKLRIPRTFA